MMTNTQQIARMAADMKKPNKAELFNIVSDIIDYGKAADVQLAALYSFFLPPVTKIKTPFHWLVKARGIKDVRYYLNYVYSDGSRTFSTDGHRAHILNEERPTGFYDDNDQLINNQDWAKFPDIERVMPSSGVHYVIDINTLPIHIVDSKVSLYVMPDGWGMNKAYIDQACGLSTDYKIEYWEERNLCKVTYYNAEAVVMGRKIDKGDE